MIKILIKDWSKGFVALDLIHFLKDKGFGLVESKLMVERLLDRKEILICLDNDEGLENILSMPIIYEIRKSETDTQQRPSIQE